MNIIFLGTPDFALPALEALVRSQHRITGIFCQPDKPAGRHLPMHTPPVGCTAREKKIPLYQPRTLKSRIVRKEIEALDPEALVVVAYGKILPSEILSIPPRGCVNLHPSLLPKYRGASPIQAAIAGGQTVTGVTTMLMDEGMDTGPILMQKEWMITEEDTSETLREKLSRVGAELVVDTLDSLEEDRVQPRPQDEAKATVCRPLRREDGKIRWELSAKEIYNRFRAYIPWPGSFTYFRKKLFKVHWLVPLEDYYDLPPGSIVSWGKEGIRVSTGRGCVVITHVQLEGRKRITAEEFSCGAQIGKNERFTDHP